MKKLLLSLCLMSGTVGFAQNFGVGNLVVYRYGDGLAPMPANTIVPVFLDEYSTTGTLISIKGFPTLTIGANKRLTGLARVSSGTYQQEGISTLSQDGKYITIFGYNQTPGGSVPETSDGLVVGIIAADGSYNSTTTLSNIASTGLGAPRSAVVKDNQIWANGFQNGVQYTTIGASTSTRVSTQQNAPRSLAMFNNVLYAPIGNSANLAQQSPPPSSSVTFTTVTIATPTPTTNQVAVCIVGGRLRLYIADDATSTIRRYYMNDAGNSWVVDGTVSTAATAFLKSIICVANESGSNTIVDVYATTWGNDGTGSEPSKLIKMADTYVTALPKNTPSTSAVTVLATAPANTLFKSVTFAPVGSSAVGTGVLPLSLKSFNAGVDGKAVKVWWSTLNEVNVQEFFIERSSDAVSFEKIGSQAARNSAQAASYTFTDNNLSTPVGYYRLKITDKDGRYSYSPVIRVSLNKEHNLKLTLSPNPAPGSFINISHGKADKEAVIKVYTIDGRVIQTVGIQPGATQSVINLNRLVKGNYVVEFSNASRKQVATVVKQ